MNKILVLNAFENAGESLAKREGKNNASEVEKATELSAQIKNLSGATIGERRLRQYYKQALELKSKSSDITIFQRDVIDGLCKYLEFDSYESFCESLSNSKITGKGTNKNKIELFSLIGGLVLIVLLGMLYFKDQQKWMVWKGDHY